MAREDQRLPQAAGIHQVAQLAGISDEEGQRFLHALVDLLSTTRRVTIKNFGTFRLIHRRARQMRSPLLPGPHELPERDSLKFHAAPAVKLQINGSGRARGVRPTDRRFLRRCPACRHTLPRAP